MFLTMSMGCAGRFNNKSDTYGIRSGCQRENPVFKRVAPIFMALAPVTD
jgi:hypothetical protein